MLDQIKSHFSGVSQDNVKASSLGQAKEDEAWAYPHVETGLRTLYKPTPTTAKSFRTAYPAKGTKMVYSRYICLAHFLAGLGVEDSEIFDMVGGVGAEGEADVVEIFELDQMGFVFQAHSFKYAGVA